MKTIYLNNDLFKYKNLKELILEASKYNIKIGTLCNFGNECMITTGCIINDSCEFGDDCLIGEGVVIEKFCRIGDDATIGSHSIIKENTQIGNVANIVASCKEIATIYGYKYTCTAQIDFSGEKYIQMGCKLKTLEDWKKDLFWTQEFPNDGSKESNDRLLTFKTAKFWLENQIK